MKLTTKLYRMYYILGQSYVIFLSLFLFKDSRKLISNFAMLFKGKGEILTILKKGPKFWVRSFIDVAIIRQIFDKEVYKPLFTNLKEDVTVIDIGAYIGDSAIYASGFKKVKKVIALEPVPNNIKFLRKNLAENNITKVMVLDKAVSADSRGKTIYIYQDETVASFIKSPDSSKEIRVSTISLSDLIKLVKTKKILLKCDIEGGEYELLLYTPLKVLSKIDRLMIELHLANLKDNNLPGKLIAYLNKCGFICNIKKSFFNPKYPLIYGYRE